MFCLVACQKYEVYQLLNEQDALMADYEDHIIQERGILNIIKYERNFLKHGQKTVISTIGS